MKTKIMDIEYAKRPHVVLQCDDDTVRVIPLAAFEDIAKGGNIDADMRVPIRRVVQEWLEGLQS